VTANYSLNVNGFTSLDRPVAKIEPHAGSVVVTGPGLEPTTVNTAEIFDAEGAAGLQVSTVEGAVIDVTYADEDANQHPQKGREERGSSTAGKTGGFESRTVEELRKEAAEKDIDGRSSMDKAELIAALRESD
jgi:hypothetical protein